MKKILVACLVLISLTACGNKTSLVSDPDTTIIEGNKINFTKQDLFESFKNNDYTPVVLSSLVEKVANLEGYDEETINNDLNSQIEEMKALYGDQYDMMVGYYGNEDNLKSIMRSGIITEKLTNKYFDENYEDLKNKYTPVKAKIAYFNELETAQAVLDQINNGKSFEMAAAENGYQEQIQEKVYTDKSDLALEVKTFLNTATEPTLSNIILNTVTQTANDGTTSSSNRYYIAQVTNVDVDSFKDDFFTEIAQIEDIDEILNSYFTKYDIEVFDQRTYELLSKKYKGIK